ncbi:MAG: hypothetical protein Kow0089_22700 [Desulfobulbaceae bacterium]
MSGGLYGLLGVVIAMTGVTVGLLIQAHRKLDRIARLLEEANKQ